MNRLILILILFSSCTNARKVARWMDNNTPQAAVICDEKFPFIETPADTQYVQDVELLNSYEAHFAEMSHLIDSLLQSGCDTVTIEKVKEKILQLPAKPGKTKLITKVVESTAKLTILRDSVYKAVTVKDKENAKLKSKVEQLQKRVDNRTKQRNYLVLALLALLVWVFRKPLRMLIFKV